MKITIHCTGNNKIKIIRSDLSKDNILFIIKDSLSIFSHTDSRFQNDLRNILGPTYDSFIKTHTEIVLDCSNYIDYITYTSERKNIHNISLDYPLYRYILL